MSGGVETRGFQTLRQLGQQECKSLKRRSLVFAEPDTKPIQILKPDDHDPS
jgi:hypothetical protein